MTSSFDTFTTIGTELSTEQLEQATGGAIPLLIFLGYGLICGGVGVGVGYVLAQ